jgi:regulator of protease activity HflC (stomatin/prohibitin superfamily)
MTPLAYVAYVAYWPKEALMKTDRSFTEKEFTSFNGYLMLLIGIAAICFAGYRVFSLSGGISPSVTGVAFIAALIFAGALSILGLYMLQPNEGGIITLFGDYRGTDRASGLRWCFPFYTRRKISLRSRNLNSEKLKVNDKNGNPIEIGAAIVWRVRDTAQAVFEIDDYEMYVRVQSESAIRHLASAYSYDNGGDDTDVKNGVTLRGGADIVAKALASELQDRFDKAGISVEEAKLTHLAYAPEIASAMLRRQQAEAVIDARAKIVHGAVTMVEMALKGLSDKNIVHLDDERKAAMVSNLLVVLCAESNVQPIVNTGTLYN